MDLDDTDHDCNNEYCDDEPHCHKCDKDDSYGDTDKDYQNNDVKILRIKFIMMMWMVIILNIRMINITIMLMNVNIMTMIFMLKS